MIKINYGHHILYAVGVCQFHFIAFEERQPVDYYFSILSYLSLKETDKRKVVVYLINPPFSVSVT